MNSFGVVGKVASPDPFFFQIKKEALHYRFIPGVAFTAHAADQGMLYKLDGVHVTRVLRSTVGIRDNVRTRIAPRDNHLQGWAYQRCEHLGIHGVADDFARMQVQHRRQVQRANAGANVGGVTGLSLVRQLLNKLAGHRTG